MGSSCNYCLSLFCFPSLHRSRHYLLFSDNFTAFQGDGPSSLFVGSTAAAAASVGCTQMLDGSNPRTQMIPTPVTELDSRRV